MFEFVTDPRVAENRRSIKAAMYGKSAFARIGTSVRTLIENIIKPPYFPKRDLPTGGKWVIIGTKNHLDSMRFLTEGCGYHFLRLHKADFSEPILHRRLVLEPRSGLLYLPLHLYNYFTCCRGQITDLLRALGFAITSAGIYEHSVSLLTKYRPECLVVSNDHLPPFRSLVMAAKAVGIPTIYIQHACIAVDFPSLITDLNLLEGEDARQKYQRKTDNNPLVELIGMPKYDSFANVINSTNGVRTIGIPYNKVIDTDLVMEIAERLAGQFPDINFIVRPHPGDERARTLPELPNVSLSDALVTPAFEFLSELDAVISSYSSILLEAAMLNVYPILFAGQGEDINDVYQFIANGLVDPCYTISELLDTVADISVNRPEVRSRTQIYCATIGTVNEGRSAELARQRINSFVTSANTT